MEDLRSRRGDNVKIDVIEIWWGVDYIDMAEDNDKWLAVVNMPMNFQVP